MEKSKSGVTKREGTIVKIGDNRYGMREAYDPVVDEATKEYYRNGDKMTVREVKSSSLGIVRTEKPTA